MFDGSDVVMKECRPKVTDSNYFLGSGHSKEMVTTSTNMEIIEDSLNFLMSDVVAKYGVHSPLV